MWADGAGRTLIRPDLGTVPKMRWKMLEDKKEGAAPMPGPGEVVDLEEYARRGITPPNAKTYRIRVDKTKYDVSVPSMTGRQILALAGKTPVERFMLSEKLHGGQVKPIGLDDVANFSAPGVERFMTLAKDQTEG